MLKKLSKKQMKEIKAGTKYICRCFSIQGQWTGNYASDKVADASIGKWCANEDDGFCIEA